MRATPPKAPAQRPKSAKRWGGSGEWVAHAASRSSPKLRLWAIATTPTTWALRVARPPRKSLAPQKADAASPRPIKCRPGLTARDVIAADWLLSGNTPSGLSHRDSAAARPPAASDIGYRALAVYCSSQGCTEYAPGRQALRSCAQSHWSRTRNRDDRRSHLCTWAGCYPGKTA